MKYLIILAFSFLSLSAAAQNYNDSTITLQLTQRAAWYVGFHIKQQSVWNDRLAPATLKNYVGSGNNQDSLFTVTLKASYVKGMVELLLAGGCESVSADRLSIIMNSPTIAGYTSLASQITTKAAGATSEKLVAQFILDYYNLRVLNFANLRTENKNSVISWSKN